MLHNASLAFRSQAKQRVSRHVLVLRSICIQVSESSTSATTRAGELDLSLSPLKKISPQRPLGYLLTIAQPCWSPELSLYRRLLAIGASNGVTGGESWTCRPGRSPAWQNCRNCNTESLRYIYNGAGQLLQISKAVIANSIPCLVNNLIVHSFSSIRLLACSKGVREDVAFLNHHHLAGLGYCFRAFCPSSTSQDFLHFYRSYSCFHQE